jgi:hypothetical protein
MLTYAKALPKYQPDFQRYLLAHPNAKSENMSDLFYWAKVKFGLKPTLRVVHVVTLRGRSANEAAIAENSSIRAITSRPRWTSHFVSAALTIQSSLVLS